MSSCNPPPPDPPNLWSRATLSCVNYDQEQLDMRRKAEILKYKGNQNPLTKKQQWSRIVKGNGPLGKKVWATQNDLGSNPNVFNLQQVGNTLILCPNDDTEDKYFAYVANTLDGVSPNGNVFAYRINQTTGMLSFIGSFPTGISPSSMSVDPNGKFLYVTNADDNNVSGYMIDQTTGELVPTVNSPYNSISFPQSIITVRISAKKNTIKCAPSSASDVPGNSVLCYDPAVPLVNYLPPQRTFLAGGTKWPQSTWKPGDNGFPRGKKGSMNMLFQ